jgi:hypothetical protein
MMVALIAALVATGGSTFESAAVEKCRTGDSALCAADPNCHWDYERRGCYEGSLDRGHGCAAHGDKQICEADNTLGCNWSAASNKCESVK